MARITVIVEFETFEGHGDAFTAMMLQHARKTLEEEPGCLRFEVIRPLDEDGTEGVSKLIVNELYSDQAAYEAHNENPRMPGLQAATAPLLKSKRLILARAVGVDGASQGKRPEDLNAANDG